MDMDIKIILRLEIPVLLSQTAAALISGFAGASFFFFVFQFCLALFLFFNYKDKIPKSDITDLYFFVSMIFALPFICFWMIRRTAALSAPAGDGRQRAENTKEELVSHIKADWDAYIDFKAVKYGKSTLASNAVPIIDLLSGDNIEIKRKSIVILHKLRTVRAITLLKKALSDANVEIKFMSASALLNIENDFKERIKEMDEEIERAEDEGYCKIHELRYNLAALISKYLMSGLLDDIGQKRLSDRMHELLNRASADNENYVEARALLAEEYYKKAMYKEALAIVESAMKSPALSGCASDVKISLVMLVCEIHYRLCDIVRLRQACASINNYLTPEILKKRPELIDFEKSVRYFSGEKIESGLKKAVTANG
jgi:tetratricopeptide (TPR) repeat protein